MPSEDATTRGLTLCVCVPEQGLEAKVSVQSTNRHHAPAGAEARASLKTCQPQQLSLPRCIPVSGPNHATAQHLALVAMH